MSIVCVGDIHGSYKTLVKLLEQFPDDQICLVGDLVDRGPYPLEVIDFVMKNQDRIKCVLGNHELMMMDFYKKRYAHLDGMRMGNVWLRNGGDIVYEAYQEYSDEKLKSHLDFLDSLPAFIEFKDVTDADGRYLIVSHSVIVDKDLDECVLDKSIFWGRSFPQEDVSEGKWFNVFGHTPVSRPIVTDWYANIDTGCCFEGKQFYNRDNVLMPPEEAYLTAFKWPEKQIFQVRNVDVQK